MKKLFILLVGVLILSCGKDDEVQPSVDPPVYLIKSVYLDEVLIRDFDYYPNNQLKTNISYLSGGTILKEHFEYLNDTIFVATTTEDEEPLSLKKYFEIDETTRTMEFYDADGELKNYRIYQFDNANCSFTKLSTYKPDGELSWFFETDFSNDKCSSITNSYDSGGTLTSKEQLTRNDHQISVYNDLADFLMLNNMGTVDERIVWDEANMIVDESSYTAEFEYNQAGHLLSETKTLYDGTVHISTWEYY